MTSEPGEDADPSAGTVVSDGGDDGGADGGAVTSDAEDWGTLSAGSDPEFGDAEPGGSADEERGL